ncbi:MAG: hydrogenase nickel incorporation protein HypA [bacterium]|nr:hydrogenase nickel incorporation protein HypA [bacterium]
MHEISLAKAAYDTIISICSKNNKNINQIKEIVLTIGEIQNIDLELFLFSLKDYLNEVELKYDIVKAKLKCNNCFTQWDYSQALESLKEEEKEAIHFLPETIHAYIKCPNCKSIDFLITEGRGIYISSITFNNNYNE